MIERIKSTERRMLIIDDNRQIHLDIKKILMASENKDSDLENLKDSILETPKERKEKEFIIDCALQGEEGLGMVKESLRKNKPYSVAFVDVRIPPGMDGIETISRLWKIDPELQVVICTAYSDYSQRDIEKRLGQTDKLLILKKPFDGIEVRQLAQALSEKWEMTRIAQLRMSIVKKKLEKSTWELDKTKSRLEIILDNAAIHIAFINETGKYCSWNKASYNMFGYTEEEVIEKHDPSLIHKNRRIASDIADNAVENGMYNSETYLVRKDGTEFPAHFILIAIAGQTGSRTSFAEVAIDVSERLMAEKAGREAKEKLRKKELRYRMVEEDLLKYHESQDTERRMLGNSQTMLNVHRLIEKVAKTDTAVLIYGETGTGKELTAHAIHSLSFRKEKPLGIIDCSTIPNELLESELFGYERGAFTGAYARKKGLFESSDGGTIFLDEVHAIPIQMQSKLLRVLEENEIRRVGGTKRIKIDVRIIAAGSTNLKLLVREKKFREDLYYRLNVFTITLPPLRERGNDILLLAHYFLSRYGANSGIKGFSKEAEAALTSYHWPGNVRELQHKIERGIILCDSDRLLPEDFEFEDHSLFTKKPPFSGDGETEIHFTIPIDGDMPGKEANETLFHYMKWKIVDWVLEHTGGDVSECARILGIDRTTIYRIKKKRDL